MTIGQLAGMIAALAFAVLVVFLCINLSKLAKIMSDLKETVKRVNTTLDVVTKDVDNLSIEVEGLLNKANSLVDDVNGKLGKTDPLFTAIGDLGVTVSDLNDSTKNMTSNLFDSVAKRNKSKISKFVTATQAFSNIRGRSNKKAQNLVVKNANQGVESLSQMADQASQAQVEAKAAEDQLKAFIKTAPSKTAGEIRIKQ